jgi:zinc transporter ZupT
MEIIHWKIVSFFVIMFSGFIGIIVPKFNFRFIFQLKSISMGILLSLCLIHLIPESFSSLSELNEYPFAGLFVLTGIYLMFFTEHLVIDFIKTKPSDIHSHDHLNAITVANENGNSRTSILIEISIIIHSLIIGFDLGTMSEDIYILLIAIAFHQFFEGIVLGSYKQFGLKNVIVFSLSVPVGILCGCFIPFESDHTFLWITGSLTGVTAGILLYNTLVTFMTEEYSRQDLELKTKRQMYILMLLGAGLMAIIGIWA